MATYAFDLAALTTVAKVVVFLLGGLITGLAHRAANRTRSYALRLFSIGFAVITAGTFLGSALHALASFDLRVGVLVESLLTAIGFVLLAYSLYVTHINQPAPDGSRRS